MPPLRSSLIPLTTLALGTALGGTAPITPVGGQPALANPLDVPALTIPTQLPAQASLTLDGSSSMAMANAGFLQRLVDQFPQINIDTKTSGTPVALGKILRGEVDLVAMGRRLTQAEQDQGLVEVPISREKIALIVGPGNGFSGGLTPDQLAQIVSGNIDNWAAVGGPDRPLRFVDRPPHSDTRLALGQHPSLAQGGLSPGPTVTSVAEDSTEAVIEALGQDGLGYAVISQVQHRPDVRILSVNDLPPTDARYPYSQPRVYVYRHHNPSPATLAFLGVVNTPANLALSPADPKVTPPYLAGETTPPPARRLSIPWQRAWVWGLALPLLGGLVWWRQTHPTHQGRIPSGPPAPPVTIAAGARPVDPGSTATVPQPDPGTDTP